MTRLNHHQKTDAALFGFKLLLVGLYTAFFAYAWYTCYSPKMYIEPFFAKGDYTVILMFAVLYMFFAKLYGGFHLTTSSVGELVYAQGVSIVISLGFMYMVTWLLIRQMPALIPQFVMIGLMVASSALWAYVGCSLADKRLPPKRMVLIYGNEEAAQDGISILVSNPKRFSQVGVLGVDEPRVFQQIQQLRADGVILCGVGSSRRNDIVKFCYANRIDAYVRPTIGDLLMQGARPMQLDNLPVLLCSQDGPAVYYLAVKRAADIVLGLAAMLVFSPFMLVTAIAIKAYDGGPVFYKQVRLTKDRKEFYVYKFRSMRVDAEKDGVARLASQGDDRITPVGKIIRALRIDEMPQLWCILQGSMTIVGPRPERPEIAAQYEQSMPEFALRLQAKAGLTGLAQVYGKYNTTPYNKLQMDLQYIGSMSLVTDIKIILATIKILFMPESTEGVAQGQVTAASQSDTADTRKPKGEI